MDSLTSAVLTTQSQLSRQRKELSDLQAQVPQLYDAKKAAVTGKNAYTVTGKNAYTVTGKNAYTVTGKNAYTVTGKNAYTVAVE